MSTALLAAFAVILCILFRILNVNSQPQKPGVWCSDSNFLDTVLKICPMLEEPYVPTRLWGFSGHVQTIIHSVIGRVKCPWPIGERVFLMLPDNTTLTYDLYQPIGSFEDDVTVAICPGIGNTSESVYIRTFVHWAQRHGYRACVLNHVGALSSVPVTAPRIFSYGHTGDYHEMLRNVIERHPNTKIVCIGFSLGGNLITKYMGETERHRPSNIIGGISICQGYCATESGGPCQSFSKLLQSSKYILWLPYLYTMGTKFLLNWQNFRRFYLYVMTENMKNIILRHRNVLLNDDVKRRFNLQEKQIISAATLPELDDAYTRKIHNFDSIESLYKWSSSVNYLPNINIPMVFVNARDDPIVPEQLLHPIQSYTMEHSSKMYIELAHGGHLGFYEGGLIYPNPVTWLDRALVCLIGSMVLYSTDTAKKPIS